MTMVEKNSIVVDKSKIANIMNNYFINITKTLNLKTLNESQIDIDKLENHISIKQIHETFPEIVPGRFSTRSIPRNPRNRRNQREIIITFLH